MAHIAQAYPLSAARTLALHAQGLNAPLGSEPVPAPDAISRMIEQVGCLQIDTLHVVQRSHYLVLWSRLGCYNTAELDRLVYAGPIAGAVDNGRRLFEDWLHAACILPLSEYRYRLPTKRKMRERWTPMSGHNTLQEADSVGYHQAVLERIRRDGALRVSDFEYNGPKRAGWWDWKPAKRALENLFAWGDLMVADRVNFQRVYDLRERVLPSWVGSSEPSHEETIRHMIAAAVRSFGICSPAQVGDYDYDVKITTARPYIQDMLAEGVLQFVQVTLSDGQLQPMIVHRDDFTLLDQAADGALSSHRSTFLSPFDNLFWPNNRDRQFWGITQRLEAYKPQGQREWGYFCMSILHNDHFVGRFDPKLERSTGTLRLKALYLEPGVELASDMIAAVAAAMRSFMAQHAAHDLVIERSEPGEFGSKLLAAL